MQKTYLAYNRMGRRYKKGVGAPVSAPSRVGERYIDTSTGVQWRSRFVFDAVVGSNIAFPSVSDVSKISFRFYHNEASPPSLRQFHNATGSPANRAALTRSSATGVLSTSGAGVSQMLFNGSSILSGTTNPSTMTWHKIQIDYSENAIIDRIFNANFVGIITDFAIENTSGIVRNYAIDDNSSTISNSLGGNNATLTPSSGAWSLQWVPQN